MGPVEALILGLLQGLTEFLPVSSSGHLVVGGAFLGGEPPIFFDLIVHVATLLAILVYFRQDVIAVLRDAWRIRSRKSARSRRATVAPRPSQPLAGLGIEKTQ